MESAAPQLPQVSGLRADAIATALEGQRNAALTDAARLYADVAVLQARVRDLEAENAALKTEIATLRSPPEPAPVTDPAPESEATPELAPEAA